MKAWIWFRALAGVLLFFTLGHTIGVLKPPAAGSPAAGVLATMWRVQFPANGFVRSYGEFYRGFALFVSVHFAILAVIALQVADLSRRQPAQAVPMAVTLLAGCVAAAVLSGVYFFMAPIAMSIIAVGCSSVALLALTRDARATSNF